MTDPSDPPTASTGGPGTAVRASLGAAGEPFVDAADVGSQVETHGELAALWSDIVAELVGDPSSASQHQAWLRLTQPIGLVADTALVGAPDEFTRGLLEHRYRDLLSQALSRRLHRPVRVAVTVAVDASRPDGLAAAVFEDLPPNDDVLDKTDNGPTDELDDADLEEPPFGLAGLRLVQRGGRDVSAVPVEPPRLNRRYTFETFVIGSSNRFAHAAAVAVAEAPAKAYNPLFIYGESGLGKTHLLHAIGHYAQRLFRGARVRYASSEEFTNDFINSVRDGKANELHRRYRDVDILLVDDIQFLENKVGTQEEFFHTFNSLHLATKQIVITSDRPPKQLSTLEDRLRTRLEWGLITDVTPPELETRIAILRRKAAQDSLAAPPEVLEFIASKIQRNIRELEGALIRVTAFANLNRTPVGLALAEVVLKDLILPGGGTQITSATIMGASAAYFGLSMEDLCGSSRSRMLVTARQIAMYLCRELTDLSLPKIGAAFGGRDHTTVMHAERKVRTLMNERRGVYDQVTDITNRIKMQARS